MPRSAPTAAASRRSSTTSRGRSSHYEDLTRRAAAGEFQGLYAASDAIDPWIDEAESRGPAIGGEVPGRPGYDRHARWPTRPTSSSPAATFAEKAGCYVNADGRLQYSAAALPPRDGSLPDLDLLAILLNRPGGPVNSREVLAELAETVPAFAVAKGGKLPAFGVLAGPAAARATAPPGPALHR